MPKIIFYNDSIFVLGDPCIIYKQIQAVEDDAKPSKNGASLLPWVMFVTASGIHFSCMQQVVFELCWHFSWTLNVPGFSIVR